MDMRNRRPSPVVLRLRSSYAFRAMKLDQQEREAVLRALSVLPHDHPARIAFDQGADPIALMHLLDATRRSRTSKRSGSPPMKGAAYPAARAATNINAAPRQVIPMRLMAALGPAWEWASGRMSEAPIYSRKPAKNPR